MFETTLWYTRRTIDTTHEVICMEIVDTTIRVHILLAYRPPHETKQLIHKKIAVITGDFHCNGVLDRTAVVEENRLVDLANENFLQQLLEEPTWGQLMDPILSAEEDLVTHVTGLEPPGTNDHNAVWCLIHPAAHRIIPNARWRLNFQLANFSRFKRDLGNLQLSRVETV